MSKVRTRKRGKTWSYIFEAGRKEDGKRKVVEKGGFETKEAAYDAGAAAYTDWKHGNIGITSESVTVKEFAENWLKNVAAVNVRPTTFSSYTAVVRTWIVPFLAEIKMQDLTPAMLDKWMRGLHKKGLAYLSLRKALVLLRGILDYAIYPAGIIMINPARYIKIPKSAPKGVVPRIVISPEQMTTLLKKHPQGDPARIVILLLYHTGMRIGEVLGLAWDGIDLAERVITVSQQIVYVQVKRGNFLVAPKTTSSIRKFRIDAELCQALEEWHRIQQEDEEIKGDSYAHVWRQEEDGRIVQQSKGLPVRVGLSRVALVCTRRDGMSLSRQSVMKMLTVEGLNAHSFRHTHATVLIENGAMPKGVAGRLGHASTAITQDLYTHNTEKLQKDTAAIFEKSMQTSYKSRQNADSETL